MILAIYEEISYLQGATLTYPGNDNTLPAQSKGLRGKKCQ